MQGSQAQVIQLLASGSCYGSCTRLKSILIEVIFSAGRYLTTVPWPPLWQFEKLKDVCIPLQHSLPGIFSKEVVPMAPWCAWWDNAVASGTKCHHTVQWAHAATSSHSTYFASSSAQGTDHGGNTDAGEQEGTFTLCKSEQGFGQVIFFFSLMVFWAKVN